jgi:hypothetical protein
VTSKITKKYDDLRRLGVRAILRDGTGSVLDPGNPALVSCRQIAFEVDVAIHEQLPDLVGQFGKYISTMRERGRGVRPRTVREWHVLGA